MKWERRDGRKGEEKVGGAGSRGFVVAFKMLKAIMVDVESGHCRQWKREVLFRHFIANCKYSQLLQ